MSNGQAIGIERLRPTWEICLASETGAIRPMPNLKIQDHTYRIAAVPCYDAAGQSIDYTAVHGESVRSGFRHGTRSPLSRGQDKGRQSNACYCIERLGDTH